MPETRQASERTVERTIHGGLAVNESGIDLRPDPSRVITRLFVPGREDVGPGDSRATPVIDRILHLDDASVDRALADVDTRFADRHRNLHNTFIEHSTVVTLRLDEHESLSESRLLLLGASFTHEYAIEGAALCNPSAVLHPHPDQQDGTQFIMSVRGIGEGHRSSIGFRTGRLSTDGTVTIDQPGKFPAISSSTPGVHHREVFSAKLTEMSDDRENAAYVLDALPEVFDTADLEAQIDSLAADSATRRRIDSTIGNLRDLAHCSYQTTFPDETHESERVLWPQAPAERQGMEDARFVRFTANDGTVTYYATYTAFDGINVSQQLLTTVDFQHFTASPMAGSAATGKGLALFPRMINGMYVALSRSDRESNAIAFSDDLFCWPTSELLQIPIETWEILQLGNCGSPIETSAGWLVVTHGVGPMRTYSLGAILLDLDDPRIVLARTTEPIMTPDNDRRNGYVPNVMYSCGGFAHQDTLVLPYGIGDQTISIATMSISELVASMNSCI